MVPTHIVYSFIDSTVKVIKSEDGQKSKKSLTVAGNAASSFGKDISNALKATGASILNAILVMYTFTDLSTHH